MIAQVVVNPTTIRSRPRRPLLFTCQIINRQTLLHNGVSSSSYKYIDTSSYCD